MEKALYARLVEDLRYYIKKNYIVCPVLRSSETSDDMNYDDIFKDGIDVGTSWTLYNIAKLCMELENQGI